MHKTPFGEFLLYRRSLLPYNVIKSHGGMKQKLGASIDVYHDILKKSFQRVLQYRSLWLFGFFAAFINSGTIFYHVMQFAARVKPLDHFALDQFAENPDILTQGSKYLYILLEQNTVSVTAIVFIIAFFVMFMAIIGLSSQQILIKGLVRKENVHPKEAVSDVSRMHVLQLFFVNAFLYLSLAALFGIASLLLSVLLSPASSANAFVYVGIYIFLLPVAFYVNMVGMLALIEVVRTDSDAIQAIRHATHLISKHWLAAIEMSVGLFLANLLFSIIGTAIAFIILLIAAILAIAAGTASSASIILASAGIIIGILVIVYSAFITAFSYQAWIIFSKRISRFGIIPVIERMFRTLFSKRAS